MRKQAGLSLVELMISITLGLVLMAGVVQMFLSSKRVFITQQGMSRIQETGRLGIEFMSRDIRAAARYGCLRSDPATNNIILQDGDLDLGGLHTDFAEGVRGYDSAEDLPNGAEEDLGLAEERIDEDESIIVLRSAADVGFPVNNTSNGTQVFTHTTATDVVDNCVDDICKNKAVIVSDCYSSRVFQVTDLSVDANTLTITHAPGWGGDAAKQLEIFSEGEVAPVTTTVYFIAEGAGGQPSLWQRKNDENALELLEGVERMRITYAPRATIDNPNPIYSLAADIDATEWPLINSVRVELLVRSLENNVQEDPQPYTFGDVLVDPAEADPDDRYLRQVFTTTIGIRSREN